MRLELSSAVIKAFGSLASEYLGCWRTRFCFGSGCQFGCQLDADIRRQRLRLHRTFCGPSE
jgi:hypothetical protein